MLNLKKNGLLFHRLKRKNDGFNRINEKIFSYSHNYDFFSITLLNVFGIISLLLGENYMHLLVHFLLGGFVGALGIVFLAYKFPAQANKTLTWLEGLKEVKK
jgi:hypothetical protein